MEKKRFKDKNHRENYSVESKHNLAMLKCQQAYTVILRGTLFYFVGVFSFFRSVLSRSAVSDVAVNYSRELSLLHVNHKRQV